MRLIVAPHRSPTLAVASLAITVPRTARPAMRSVPLQLARGNSFFLGGGPATLHPPAAPPGGQARVPVLLRRG